MSFANMLYFVLLDYGLSLMSPTCAPKQRRNPLLIPQSVDLRFAVQPRRVALVVPEILIADVNCVRFVHSALTC